MLWLCAHFSELPLDLHRRAAPDDPLLAIVEGEGREQRVAAASEGLRRFGVRPGMRLSEAHALAGELRAKPRDPIAERDALEHLAAWSGQYTSCVSLVRPHALLLEVEGSLNLYAGLDRLVEHMRNGLRDLGYTAQLAVAPTPLAATWLARSAKETKTNEVKIFDHAALFRALADLPLTCLDLAPDGLSLLTGMGLTTLIDCLRLPRDGIARRVGPEILDALDRAFGRLPDPRASFTPPERFRTRLGLPAPVATHEALMFPLHRMLRELAGFLAAHGAGAGALDITLHSTRAQSTRLSLKLVAPSRDVQHLAGVVRERLERTALAAPVEEIILVVDVLLPLAPQPLELFVRATAPEILRAQAVDRLQARLGREAVRGITVVAEHRPERAWRSVDPETLISAASGASDARDRTVAVSGPFAQDKRFDVVQEACPLPIPSPASGDVQGSTKIAEAQDARERSRGLGKGRSWPLWLLPDPLALETRDHRPYCGGALALEPERERIESGWWDGAEIARDYFVARNPQGRRFWIFRHLYTSQWFLHGVFG